MIKKLLIIPARIGSKRIKNKNIKKFFGKPIINYSIETALKSKIFDEIHVSTDSLKVKNIVKRYPINIDFLRPKKLSGSKVGLIKVYEFIVKKFLDMGKKFDQIWFLTPCSPLIDTKDLISASKFIKKNKVRNLLAITEYLHPIQRAFKLSKSKKLSPELKSSAPAEFPMLLLRSPFVIAPNARNLTFIAPIYLLSPPRRETIILNSGANF